MLMSQMLFFSATSMLGSLTSVQAQADLHATSLFKPSHQVADSILKIKLEIGPKCMRTAQCLGSGTIYLRSRMIQDSEQRI
jgi:hypothetical protein